MDLFEYQGKQYFARYDIPVSPGGPADTVDEAVVQADQAGYPVVVKAQVQVGGRGKAGGIQLADDADAVREHAGNILGMDIKGHTVRRLWIERASDIDDEYYVSFTLDRSAKKHLMMLSAEGGVEIEAVAESNPDAIVKLHIDPVDGLSAETARQACVDAELPERAVDGAAEIIVKLYRCYTEGDCDLAEINPLILKPTGEVHALDAKVTLDGNAEFRHPEWEDFKGLTEMDEREQMAAEKDLQYIGLEGSVGIIANGAGLAMSTLDMVNQVGGAAANFLDIGGGANADVMAGALEVINFDESVKAIFINIFGGITRGEEVAKGIVEGARSGRPQGPDRHPPRRHERRGGTPDPGRRRHRRRSADLQADHARGRPDRGRHRRKEQLTWRSSSTRTPRSSSRASRAGRAAITVSATATTGPRSSEASRPARAVRTWTASRSTTASRTRWRRPVANASFVAVPPKFASGAIIEAAEAGIGFVVCITEGIPAQDEATTYNRLVREFPNTRLLGPNCPGIISPGKCNIGITAGEIAQPPLVRQPERRDREPVRHAHLPGAVRAEAERHRRVDVCRHRRRSGAGHQLHRLPPRVRGRPRARRAETVGTPRRSRCAAVPAGRR